VVQEIGRQGGTVVKTTGDGVLATLPSADAALRAAVAIRTRLAEDDLDVRVGLHVGDVERRGDDLAGVAVHAAARVMALAGAGEILATTPMEMAATGGEHRFELAGDHALKGLRGVWTLYRYLGHDPP
jgi:class 3 adenylate cyclase